MYDVDLTWNEEKHYNEVGPEYLKAYTCWRCDYYKSVVGDTE